jgi:hypothetical protein
VNWSVRRSPQVILFLLLLTDQRQLRWLEDAAGIKTGDQAGS